jgi:hypothetical protein
MGCVCVFHFFEVLNLKFRQIIEWKIGREKVTWGSHNTMATEKTQKKSSGGWLESEAHHDTGIFFYPDPVRKARKPPDAR